MTFTPCKIVPNHLLCAYPPRLPHHVPTVTVLCRRIHTFTSLDAQGAAVSCIEPSPALDVAGVGLDDGRVQVIMDMACKWTDMHEIDINR